MVRNAFIRIIITAHSLLSLQVQTYGRSIAYTNTFIHSYTTKTISILKTNVVITKTREN